MFENLFNLIKEQSNEAVINNPAIPNEKNDAVIADATHAVAEGMQNELASGRLSNLLSLFKGSDNTQQSGGAGSLLNNPIVSGIIGNFTNKLINNHAVAPGQAGGIAGNLIPGVIGSLINKTNDPNNKSFDLSGIIQSLTGGSGGNATSGISNGLNLGGLVNQFTGGNLDADKDGDVGLDDIIAKVTSAAQQQQGQQGGGGFMDIIKNFMK